MARKSEADAAKERKRADAAKRHAKRYADPKYRALGYKSMLANGSLKNAPILSGTPNTKSSSANTTEQRGSTCPTGNGLGSGLTPSSPPIRNGVNGTMRNSARDTTVIRRSGRES